MITENNLMIGAGKQELKEFLDHMGLRYEDGIEYSVCIKDENGKIKATGSLEENILKCIAVDRAYQGTGLCGIIVSELVHYAFSKGRAHLFLFTRPENETIFSGAGFYPVIRTEEIVFMENWRNGFEKFATKIKEETPEDAIVYGRRIGAIVTGALFSDKQRELVKWALEKCDYLHLFLPAYSEGKIGLNERWKMAEERVRDLSGVILHCPSDYLIPPVILPTYSFSDKNRGWRANCRLYLELFAQKIAPALLITDYFNEMEMPDRIRRIYGEEMKKILIGYGICVHEIESNIHQLF